MVHQHSSKKQVWDVYVCYKYEVCESCTAVWRTFNISLLVWCHVAFCWFQHSTVVANLNRYGCLWGGRNQKMRLEVMIWWRVITISRMMMRIFLTRLIQLSYNRFTYSISKKIDYFLIPHIEFWEISQSPDESEKYEELILLAFFLHLRTSPCGLVASVLTPRYTNSTPNLVHQLP